MVTLSSSTLLDSPELYKIEFNLISLFERTFKKGINEQSVPKLKTSVKRQFSSNTFKIQLDKMIDDLYLYTVNSTDELIKTTLKADFTESCITHVLSAADTNTQEEENDLTEEAVITCLYLAGEISDSIVNEIKKEPIPPEKTTSRILDLWTKYKSRVETWAKTFSVNVANNVASYRYQQQGIEECQFIAVIDNRTSHQCRILNGTIFKCGSEEAKRFLPPLHPRCRSNIIPISNTQKSDDALRYENRDFTKPVDQNSKFTGEEFNQKDINIIFENVDKYKGKYTTPQHVLTKDIKNRFNKLGVDVETKNSVIEKTKTGQVITQDDVKTKIQDFEKTIKDNVIEHGAVFSTKGDIIIKRVGNVDQIEWPREELEAMRGTILTHNHSNNAGFSPEDISFACRNGLKEMRAVGPTRSYSMHFADGRDFTNTGWEKLESGFDHNYQMGVAKERLRYKNNPDPSKEWNVDKATEHIANYAWSQTVKKIDGLVYKVDVV